MVAKGNLPRVMPMGTSINLIAYALLFLAVVLIIISLWKTGRRLETGAFWLITLSFACITLALVQTPGVSRAIFNSLMASTTALPAISCISLVFCLGILNPAL